MRIQSRIVAAISSLGLVAALVVACGSEDSEGPSAPDGGGNGLGFGKNDSGATPTCKRTCQQLQATCGPQGDGCGGVMDCGSCKSGEYCGGGGVSTCGAGKLPDGGPLCQKKFCFELGADCGQQGDGCEGTIDCGTCKTGYCGGGGPSKCGSGPTDDAGQSTSCVKRTCADVNATCGFVSDNCGAILDCNPPGTPPGGSGCPNGSICGGNGIPNQCGTGTLPDGGSVCAKKTCANYPAGTCGPQGDGCGGLTVDCSTLLPGGACPAGTTCGGSGVPNQCGAPNTTTDAGCTTPLCNAVVNCGVGVSTTLSGTVYAPNGFEPLYGAAVRPADSRRRNAGVSSTATSTCTTSARARARTSHPSARTETPLDARG